MLCASRFVLNINYFINFYFCSIRQIAVYPRHSLRNTTRISRFDEFSSLLRAVGTYCNTHPFRATHTVATHI